MKKILPVILMTLLALPAHAKIEFYTMDKQYISVPENTGNMQHLEVYDYDSRCAYSTPQSSNVQSTNIYSCDGRCTSNISGKTTKVTVAPNGSFFTTTTGKSYVCDAASGRWTECVGTGGSGSALQHNISLRQNCTGGYSDRPIDLVGPSRIDDFCHTWGAYDLFVNNLNNFFQPFQRNCSYVFNDTTKYQYTSCKAGFYLANAGNGPNCVACSGTVQNGYYSTFDGNTSSSCTLYCYDGYRKVGNSCISGCSRGYYNSEQYGGNYECKACPAGAQCNGEMVFCPAGTFVKTDSSGRNPSGCQSCNEGALVWSQYDGNMEDCNGDAWAWGKGASTTCLWTDVYGSDPDSVSCTAWRGEDGTGNYEYREPGGDWYECYYRD